MDKELQNVLCCELKHDELVGSAVVEKYSWDRMDDDNIVDYYDYKCHKCNREHTHQVESDGLGNEVN